MNAVRPPAEVTIEVTAGEVTVTVTGELDMLAEPALRAALGRAVPVSPARLVIDLSGVRFIDAACARVIGEAAGSLPAGRRVLRAPSLAVRRVLDLTGLSICWEVEP